MPTKWSLGAVCVLGLALRVWGLSWGLPDLHHPDEPWILNRALAFAKGDLNPHNFLYPTLYFYVLFAWEGMFFVVGRLAGWYGSVAAFDRAFFVDPSSVVLAGRALTALFGVLTAACALPIRRAPVRPHVRADSGAAARRRPVCCARRALHQT